MQHISYTTHQTCHTQRRTSFHTPYTTHNTSYTQRYMLTLHYTSCMTNHTSYTHHKPHAYTTLDAWYMTNHTPYTKPPHIIHHTHQICHTPRTPHITRHTPHIFYDTPHTSHTRHYIPHTTHIIHNAPYMSHTTFVIHFTSCMTHHTPRTTHHTLRTIYHTTHTPRIIWHITMYDTLHTPYYTSCTIHHLSYITHHMSYTTHHMPHNTHPAYYTTPHTMYKTQHTPHYTSYTTHHIYNSSCITHHTQQHIIHYTSIIILFAPRTINDISHTTHHIWHHTSFVIWCMVSVFLHVLFAHNIAFMLYHSPISCAEPHITHHMPRTIHIIIKQSPEVMNNPPQHAHRVLTQQHTSYTHRKIYDASCIMDRTPSCIMHHLSNISKISFSNWRCVKNCDVADNITLSWSLNPSAEFFDDHPPIIILPNPTPLPLSHLPLRLVSALHLILDFLVFVVSLKLGCLSLLLHNYWQLPVYLRAADELDK